MGCLLQAGIFFPWRSSARVYVYKRRDVYGSCACANKDAQDGKTMTGTWTSILLRSGSTGQALRQ